MVMEFRCVMTFERKKYRTRGGDEVVVVFLWSPSPFNSLSNPWPVIGYHETLGRCAWKADGSYNFTGESKHDLIDDEEKATDI